MTQVAFRSTSSSEVFAWLISPIRPSKFEDDYYENDLCVIRRSDATYYTDLLSISDLDNALGTHDLVHGEINVVRGDDDIPRKLYATNSGLIDPVAVTKLFDEGSTITFNQFHRRIPALGELCATLGNVFSSRMQTNIYLTPPNAQGFKPHWDTHDVFVLQVLGRKEWSIHDAKAVLPLKGQAFDAQTDDPGPVSTEFALGPGDAVYIPRGLTHSARSTGEVSLHITLGVTAFTWTDFLVEHVAEVALRDSRLRQALPLRFTDEKLSSEKSERLLQEKMKILTSGSSAQDVWNRFRKDLMAANTPLLTDLLASRLDGERIAPVSCWKRRRGLRVELTSSPEGVALCFAAKEVQFPESMRPAVEFVSRASTFRAADIPDCLDGDGKVTLVLRLAKEGLLQRDMECVEGSPASRSPYAGATARTSGNAKPHDRARIPMAIGSAPSL